MIDKLIDIYKGTFRDKCFTREEKKEVETLLKMMELTAREVEIITNKIFDIARMAVSESNDQLIFDWLQIALKTLTLGNDNQPIEEDVFFSPGFDCQRAIINYLRRSKQSVNICVFTISDDVVTNQLISCKQQGINVRIITDNKKVFDEGSDINFLKQNGIPIKYDGTPGHMHHKFMVVDNKYALTGSYNWTKGAAKFNQENVIVTSSQSIIYKFNSEFEKLWNLF